MFIYISMYDPRGHAAHLPTGVDDALHVAAVREARGLGGRGGVLSEYNM